MIEGIIIALGLFGTAGGLGALGWYMNRRERQKAVEALKVNRDKPIPASIDPLRKPYRPSPAAPSAYKPAPKKSAPEPERKSTRTEDFVTGAVLGSLLSSVSSSDSSSSSSSSDSGSFSSGGDFGGGGSSDSF
jgi:uncharacterized membrane protein YgcG